MGILTGLLLSILAQLSTAGPAGCMQITKLNAKSKTYTLGSNVTLKDGFCVRSTTGGSCNGGRRNWRIWADTTSHPLELTMAGESNLPLRFVRVKGRVGGAWQPWIDITTTPPATFDYDGYRASDCGNNGKIRLRAIDSVLMAARAGTWVALIDLVAENTRSLTDAGTFQASITVPVVVEVSGLTDIILSYAGTGDLVDTRSFCIYANNAVPESVDVTISSLNGTGQFALNGVVFGGTVPYSLEFDNAASGTSWQTVTEGAALTGQNVTGGALSALGGCSNVQLRLTAQAAQLQAAVTDSYADTITILVTPI